VGRRSQRGRPVHLDRGIRMASRARASGPTHADTLPPYTMYTGFAQLLGSQLTGRGRGAGGVPSLKSGCISEVVLGPPGTPIRLDAPLPGGLQQGLTRMPLGEAGAGVSARSAVDPPSPGPRARPGSQPGTWRQFPLLERLRVLLMVGPPSERETGMLLLGPVPTPGQGIVHQLLPVRGLERAVDVDALRGQWRVGGSADALVTRPTVEVDGQGLHGATVRAAAVTGGQADKGVTGLTRVGVTTACG
jgi:hypothetical protein